MLAAGWLAANRLAGVLAAQLVAREGTPCRNQKNKWGAHSVRADILVLALQLRTIPSFKRADNDEKGLEQTRKAKSTLSEQWENAEADHRQRIQTDSEVHARRRVHYRKDRPNADLTDKIAPVKW